MSAIRDARTGRKIVAWRDAIPLRYEYTAGSAGEKFLRGLVEGRIVASKCPRCGEVRLPPRSYCLQCYGRTRIDVDVLHHGRIAALSPARPSSGEAALQPGEKGAPGFVTFAGVSGGLLHRVLRAGGRRPRVGDPVRAVFAPPAERKGAILDLRGFAVGGARRRGKR